MPPGGGRLLDIGPSENAPLSKIASDRGYDVTAIGLQKPHVPRGVEFVHGDLLNYMPADKFNWVLNVSSIEHFGLAGRYDVETSLSEGDIWGMRKLLEIMEPGATMILTIPVGIDSVFSPMHRVYGKHRLPRLLWGYMVIHSTGYVKREGKWNPAPIEVAMREEPTTEPWYYGIGCFTLMRRYDWEF